MVAVGTVEAELKVDRSLYLVGMGAYRLEASDFAFEVFDLTFGFS